MNNEKMKKLTLELPDKLAGWRNKRALSIPSKWEQYLSRLADDHQVDLNSVTSELCTWAFSNSESKKQFKLWLEDAFPPKGYAEDKARTGRCQW